MTGRACRAVLVLVLSSLPWEVRAQNSMVALAGIGCRARDAAVFLNSKETTAGWCAGALGALTLGPLVLQGSWFRAERMQPTGGPALDRDAGEVRGVVGVTPIRWISLEAGFAVRAFSSDAGSQRWQIPSGGLKLTVPLGDPTLTAYVRGHYLPPMSQRVSAGQLSGKARWDLGLIAETGLQIAPRRTPLFLGFSYRLERYDFPGGAVGRLEQFDLLSVYGGVRLRK